MYTAFYKSHRVDSDTLRGMKHRLTHIANQYNETFDKAECYIFYETDRERHFVLERVNKKYPNNTIERGKWE